MGIHVGHRYIIQANRFLTAVALIIQRIYYSDFTSAATVFKDYLYVTRWGTIMTAITLICALFIPLRTSGQFQAGNKTWKVYLILFQSTMSLEFVITAYYWLQLYKPGDSIVSNILSHALPLASLTIEYFLLATPFMMRHSIFTLFFGVIYALTNLITSKVGEPPYPALAWNSPISITMGVGLLLVLVLIHTCMVALTKFKLSKYGVFYQDLASDV